MCGFSIGMIRIAFIGFACHFVSFYGFVLLFELDGEKEVCARAIHVFGVSVGESSKSSEVLV